jgi:hypothetical protein
MTDPTPAPTPAPAPTAASKAKTILHDVRVALMGAVTVGEAVLVTLPAGSVHDAVAVALPMAGAFATGLVSLGD